MIPQRIPTRTRDDVGIEQICALQQRWGLAPDLVVRLIQGADTLPFDLNIFSGARSRAEQDRLQSEGRPTAPFDQSTHADTDEKGCPRLATGADVQPALLGIRENRPSVLQFGAAMQLAGLRWGGGSDFIDGIPVDRWHVDLGPR